MKNQNRILIASELPTSVIEEFTPQTDYDFIIASMILENKKYKEYFLNNYRPFTILDNGAFEKGKAISEESYLQVIKEINPDIIVLPDEREEKLITLNRSTSFLEKYGKDFPTKKFMGVLQGKSFQEWEDVLKTYLNFGIDFIGIPSYSTNDRVEFIRQHPNVYFHALGLKFLPEIFSLRTLSNVVSLDTSLPVKFAYKTLTFSHNGADFLTVENRPDLDVTFSEYQQSCLKLNLDFLKRTGNPQVPVLFNSSNYYVTESLIDV